jgi:hypothetical protein
MTRLQEIGQTDTFNVGYDILQNIMRFGLVSGVKGHFQQYFNYIMAVSFIGRKPEYPDISGNRH